jgi:quercetin dioxygenase-like cupin family protein
MRQNGAIGDPPRQGAFEMNTSTQPLQPFSNTLDSPGFMFFGAPTLVRSTSETTGGKLMLTEHVTMPPGLASPYHTHRNEDEAFYVIDGEVAFVCDGQWIKAGPGTFVYGPRNIRTASR